MASVRLLKKEIDWMYSWALYDCFYVMQTNDDANQEEIQKIANRIVEKHNELRKRVNHPDARSDQKKTKQYFKAIQNELSKTVDEALIELGKLEKK